MIWTDGPVSVYLGDVREVLAQLPEESVQCVVTSPPYWGLRDYGTATWEGGDAACEHSARTGDLRFEHPISDKQRSNAGSAGSAGSACVRCGAARIDAQLGLEPTPEEYVANMVAVFREVRRVLRKDGTLWLNLGDSYASSSTYNTSNSLHSANGWKQDGDHRPNARANRIGLKPKDLIGMPWRVAFALQAAGWWLRADVIWAKSNPMPSSVRDRPTLSHEYLFLLSRSATYFYDADAIRTPLKSGPGAKMPDGWDTGSGGHGSFHRNGREKGKQREIAAASPGSASRTYDGFNDRWDEAEVGGELAGANARSVWTIATQGYPDAHFATYPEALVIPCIKAGSREGDTVLDPFAGSGTTLAVARRLGRRSVGIELNPDYLPLIQRRVAGSSLPLLETLNGSVVSTETDQTSAGQPDYVSRAVLHGTRPTDTP